MATRRQRSGLQGVTKLRRTLRRIEPAATEGIRLEIADAAEAIRLDAVSRAPVDEGDLVRSITAKFGRDRLTAVIGPGAKGVLIASRLWASPFATRTAGITTTQFPKSARRDLFQFFKGYWIEFGTVKMAARPFMIPAFEVNRAHFVGRVRERVRVALERASRGI